MAESKAKKNRKEEDLTVDMVAQAQGLVPPQALDVEEAVVAAMLVDPEALEKVASELPSADIFYEPKHQLIYQAILDLKNNHKAIDVITVTDRLKSTGDLEKIGGAGVIANLSNRIAASTHLETHIRVLQEKHIQRGLILAAGKILRKSFDESANIDQLVIDSESAIFDAVQNNTKKDVESIENVLSRVINNLQEMQGKTGIQGVESGLQGLDNVTLGFQKSDLIILAARPSVGKTALALNMARNAAVDHNRPVAIFSLEMSSEQLVQRLMLTETRLAATKLKGGTRLTDAEWMGINTLLGRLSQAPIYIDDTPSLPINEFSAKVKRLVKEKGVQMVVVDYLQLMQGPKDMKGGMREQEVAAISRTLKAVAKENKIPIIALSQLSRQTMNRTTSNNRPQLNDLRESGSIEQDADMVLFIHRHDYQNATGVSETDAKTTLIIAKHRNGEVKDIPLVFHKNWSEFTDDTSNPLMDGDDDNQGRVASDINSNSFENIDRGE